MAGNNWGYIYHYASTLARVVSGNHQIASHTWSGTADLTTLSLDGLKSEICQLETAFQSLIGYVPKAMRPPFLSYNATTLNDLGNMGYRVISIDIDTLDDEYQATSPATAEQNYIDGYNAGGSLSLMHDIYQNTVETIVPYVINFLATKGKKSVTVAECLGETFVSTLELVYI
jgi:peptidoglycan/xylan/chitin deacetylase (PgdA/CDA1 family)